MIADWLTGHGLAWLVAGLPWVGATWLTQANIPTVRETWRGTIGSSVVTWGIWAALSLIALIAQLQMGGWTPAAVLLVPVTGIAFGVAVGAAVRYKDQQPGVPWQWRVDAAAGAGAGLSLVALLLVDEPRAALLLTILTDVIAAIPTITMAWWPSTEQPVPTTPYTSVAISAACTLAAASGDLWQVLYPIYLVALGVGMATIIVLRRPHADPPSDDWLDPRNGRPLRPPPVWAEDLREDVLAEPRPLAVDRLPSPYQPRGERTITVSTQRIAEPDWGRSPAPRAFARFSPHTLSGERLVELIAQVHREAWRSGWHDRDRLPSAPG
jgi:hypothetical protein